MTLASYFPSLSAGNFGSAFIEIHVSSSSTADSPAVDWLTLLPSCMLMTVSDSRSGNNKTSSVVCPLERFSATTASNKWSLFKVICRQPYNLSTQFGLQNIAFFSNPPTLTPSPSPSSHRHPSPSSHPPKDTPTPDHGHKIPSLPNSAAPSKPRDPNSSKTPQRRKRPLTEPNDKEEDENEEFSGVESQSRLLRNALRGAPGVTNPILNKVAAERERAREKRFEESYEKKRLLVGELTKAAGKTDFAADYQKTPPSVEMAAAFRKISRHGELTTPTDHTHLINSSHHHTSFFQKYFFLDFSTDNQCEIGQEKECPPWGVSRRSRKGGRGRGKGRKERGETEEEVWITKRRKKLSGMISECRRVLSEAGTAGGTSGQAETLATSVEHLSPTKPNQLVSIISTTYSICCISACI